jgi:hypothetical protein
MRSSSRLARAPRVEQHGLSAAPTESASRAQSKQARHAAPSGGTPMESGLRSVLDSRFGHSFENVRVHADAEAEAVTRCFDARAMTCGNDVFFADGQYAPESFDGFRLLAHELTHVVQQDVGSGPEQSPERILSVASDPSEHEAELAANDVAMGGVAAVHAVPSAAIARSEGHDDGPGPWDAVLQTALHAASHVGGWALEHGGGAFGKGFGGPIGVIATAPFEAESDNPAQTRATKEQEKQWEEGWKAQEAAREKEYRDMLSDDRVKRQLEEQDQRPLPIHQR